MSTLKNVLIASVMPMAFAAGCATTSGVPKDPAQIVYAAKGTFAASIVIADQYAKLPRCGAGVSPLCSTIDIVERVDKEAHLANDQLNAAEQLVMNTPAGTTATQVMQAAELASQLVSSLSEDTSTLKVK